MNKSLIVVIVGFVALFVGCSAQEETPKSRLTVLNWQENQDLSAFQQDKSGRWDEIGSSRICRGYLVQIENEEYCSSRPLNDWKQFTYDGQKYYLHPLSSK